MLWVLVWVVLVLAAAGVFFLLGRDLWRKAAGADPRAGRGHRPAQRGQRPARRFDALGPPSERAVPVMAAARS